MMFTVEQIESAHEKVKSGADFPHYIQEIKKIGVLSFETWVLTVILNTLERMDFKLILNLNTRV